MRKTWDYWLDLIGNHFAVVFAVLVSMVVISWHWEKGLPEPLRKVAISSDEKIAPVQFSNKAVLYSSLFQSSPFFGRIAIDPAEFSGDKQMMAAAVQDSFGVVDVTAEIYDETGLIKIPLKLVSGDNKDGLWYGEWVVYNSDKKYVVNFKAGNIYNQENSVLVLTP